MASTSPSVKLIRASDGSGNASVATVQNTRSPGATTIQVDTVSGIPDNFYGTMGTPHTFVDPVTSEEITIISEATAVDFEGHVDVGDLEIDAISPGYTDLGSEVGDIVVLRPITEYANNIADVLDVVHEDNGQLKAGAANRALNAQQGFLINGKIVRSVASNNLTVAIKTLAGADPSTSDPVYVRIGNTMRTITAALAVTKNAGTNWMDAGGDTATLEVDYFVYLGYNATDGVVIGFCRRPDYRVYGDFNATTTNAQYCAISTITNAASTDEYENVGRFNAILSAGAGYTWSVPATDVTISRPTFTTRELQWNPTLQGLFTNAKWNKNCYYTVFNNTLKFRVKLVANATSPMAGSGAAVIPIPLLMKDYSASDEIFYIGSGGILDSGTTAYRGDPHWNTTGGIAFRQVPAARPSSTSPMTWTTNDAINMTGQVDLA